MTIIRNSFAPAPTCTDAIIEGMTPQEHLDQIQHKLDYVATLQASHDEQLGKLTEDLTEFGEILKTMAEAADRRMNVLTERTIQAMEAINRLARIADIHEDRIDILENPPQ